MRRVRKRYKKRGKKAAVLFFLLAFLSGCGREESSISVWSVWESAESERCDKSRCWSSVIAEWIICNLFQKVLCIFDGDQYGFSSGGWKKVTPCI